MIDLGVKAEIVEKSGSWFAYNGERIGQGREAARVYLKEHPKITADLEEKIRQSFGMKKKKKKKKRKKKRKRRRTEENGDRSRSGA